MDEPLPPDPYTTLSVSREATDNDIKSAYKKLALKCHPDKFLDEAVKKAKADEFHTLNQAYEILTDPAKKKEWQMHVRLAEFKKEMSANQPGRGPPKRSQTDIPLSSTFTTTTRAPSFATGPPTAQEKRQRSPERRPSYDTYDGANRSSSRKDTYDSRPRQSTRPIPKDSPKLATERKRADEKARRDRAETQERSRKYDHNVSSDSDGHRESHRGPAEQARARYDEEVEKGKSSSSRRQADESKARDDRRSKDHSSRDHKYSVQQDKARDYMTAGGLDENRPAPSRKDSSSKYAYVSAKDGRPPSIRRSSARPKDRSYDRRDEIVDYPDEDRRDRRPPSMPHTTSSPAALKIPQDSPQRSSQSYNYPRSHSPQEMSPKPTMRRSETMPSNSSRRRETAPSAKVRAEDSGYSSPESPETQFPQTFARSNSHPHIATAAPHSSTNARHASTIIPPTVPENYEVRPRGVGPAVVERKPERAPKSSSRSTYPTPQAYQTAAPSGRRIVYSYDTSNLRPSMAPHAASTHEDRGRQPSLYGEVESPFTRGERPHQRPAPERKASYRTEDVSYAKKHAPEDVRYTREFDEAYRRGAEDERKRSQRSSRDRDYDYERPSTMPRSPHYTHVHG